MVNWTLEESLKYDEELETKVMVLKVKVGVFLGGRIIMPKVYANLFEWS